MLFLQSERYAMVTRTLPDALAHLLATGGTGYWLLFTGGCGGEDTTNSDHLVPIHIECDLIC